MPASSSGTAAIVCSVVFPVLAISAVGLRFWARHVKGTRYGVDDYLIVTALILACGMCALCLYGTANASIGADLTTVAPEDFATSTKFVYFGVIVGHVCYGLIKVSVIELYKRIFSVAKFNRAANVLLGIVIAWTLAATITQVFSAWPISDYWTLNRPFAINYGAFMTSFAAMDIALDIIILCLPIPMIRKLNMDTRRKLYLAGMFWMGIFCVVATAVRLYYAYVFSFLDREGHSTSLSKTIIENIIWAEIQSCCSIIAACLPCYRPLLQRLANQDIKPWSLESIKRSFKSHTHSHSSSSRSEGTVEGTHNGQQRHHHQHLGAGESQAELYPMSAPLAPPTGYAFVEIWGPDEERRKRGHGRNDSVV